MLLVCTARQNAPVYLSDLHQDGIQKRIKMMFTVNTSRLGHWDPPKRKVTFA